MSVLTTCAAAGDEATPNAIEYTVSVVIADGESAADVVDTEAYAKNVATAAGIDESSVVVSTTVVNQVEVVYKLAGTVDTFDKAAHAAKIAAASGVDVSKVTVTVVPGSVVATAKIKALRQRVYVGLYEAGSSLHWRCSCPPS